MITAPNNTDIRYGTKQIISYLTIEDKCRVAEDFYDDTFLTDQNACTSPRIVVWIGSRIEEANLWHCNPYDKVISVLLNPYSMFRCNQISFRQLIDTLYFN